MATSKCDFPACPGYPPNLLATCAHCNSNSLHHVCQVSYEFNNSYDFPMTKKCYSCLLVTIAEYNKEKNKNSTSVPSPKDNNILPTDTSVAPQNDNNIPPTMNNNIATDTIPTNVAPKRYDFVPPSDIHILGEEGLPTQNGFSKNSGIFGIGIIFIGKAVGAESTTEKAYGRIVDIPKKKENKTDYVIEYDTSKTVDPDDTIQYTTRIPNNKENKELLKRAFALTDKEGYCFGGVKKKARKRKDK